MATPASRASTDRPFAGVIVAGVFAAALALLVVGCTPSVRDDPPIRVDPVAIAHLPGIRISLDDDDGAFALEERLGPLTTVDGLTAAVFGGSALANRDEDAAIEELDLLQELAGVLVTRPLAQSGATELAGAMGADALRRELMVRGLLPARSLSYGVRIAAGVRLIVLAGTPDGRLDPKAFSVFERSIDRTLDPVVVVVAPGLPLDARVRARALADPRIKVVMALSEAADARPLEPGGPLLVLTPDREARVVRVTSAEVTTWLVPPEGEEQDPAAVFRAPLR